MTYDPRDNEGYVPPSDPSIADHTPLSFGKYRGLTPAQVSETDPKYLVWLHDTVVNRGTLVSEVLYRECTKAPARPPLHGYSTQKRTPQEQPQAGSIAESRDHFDDMTREQDGREDDEDDIPF